MSASKQRKKSKPHSHKIPIVGPVNEAPYLRTNTSIPFIAVPNSVLARSIFGDETIVFQDENLIVSTNGQCIRYLDVGFKNRNGAAKKGSKLSWHPDMTAGALLVKVNVTGRNILHHIYVDETVRRQGIATRLVERALADIPDLCLDGRFTSDGFAFFGVKNRRPSRDAAMATNYQTGVAMESVAPRNSAHH